MGLVVPLAYLVSGVVLNTLSQYIADTRFAAPEAHIIPAIKFTATLVGAALRRPWAAAPTATPAQRRLMALIGLLDASAYTAYCLGFFACGATLANLLLSGVGQVLTAALTRWVLRRRLTGGQLGGITLVGLGLAVRVAPASFFSIGGGSGNAASAGLALGPGQLYGAGMVALAALLYSVLGVAYERLLKGGTPPPPNFEIMWHVSILGFLASAAYQALYTLPNWEALVARPMAASAASPAYVAALLALFGGLFNLHMLVQAAVFQSEGAIGVGLVNAVRGAVITVVVAALFCSPAARQLCLTRQSVISALVTTAGGAVYVLAGSGRQAPRAPGPGAAAAAEAKVATPAAAGAAGKSKEA